MCNCGYHYKDNETPALGHDYQVERVSGYRVTYVCSRCGNRRIGELIDIPPAPTVPVVVASPGDGGAEAIQAEPEAQEEREVLSTVTETHDYIYTGSRLAREVVTTTDGETSATQTVDFFYDANGAPYALKYNGTVTTTSRTSRAT